VALAHTAMRVSLRTAFQPRRICVLATLCLTLAGVLPAPAGAGWLTYTPPALTVPDDSEAGRVISIAMGELREPFRMGAIGPNEFDCSGFVFYVFKQAGLVDRIGNKRRGATAYRDWFKARGWRDKGDITKALPGDILIWGNGHHAGIYMGDGWAVSALINPWGVSIHRPLKIKLALTDVLHVQMSREEGSYNGPSPSLTPSPIPSESPTTSPTPSETPAATPTVDPAATPTAVPATTPAPSASASSAPQR
jgi:peptidoglycan DL-endopeptidase CwlO